jgi:hypothetical protein
LAAGRHPPIRNEKEPLMRILASFSALIAASAISYLTIGSIIV